MNLKELGHIIERELEVTTFISAGKTHFDVKFPKTEVMLEGHFLASPHGKGKTLALAKKDYARELAGTRIVTNAMKDDRREYNVPVTLK